MSAKKPVTIRQVAREAGVSTQTVSRVINNRPDVAQQTRLRVQQVIARLGYRPNILARSLIHRRSYTLGVVATGLDYYGPSRTLVGIERRIRDRGYSLLLDLLHHPETDNVEQILNRLLSRQVDGILWAVPEIGNNRRWLQSEVAYSPVPIIYLSMEPRPGVMVVAVDNRCGGQMAAEHLIAQGYQNIGLITGPLDWWEARQRKLGWQEALQAAGLPAEDRQVAEGDWSASSGELAFCQLLEQFPEMDALFSSNDQMALGALQHAHQIGRVVPQDLAIVGFDDTPEAPYFRPPLTTVRQSLAQMGFRAVEELIRQIEAIQNNEPVLKTGCVFIEPELVIRDSSIFTRPSQ